MRDIEFIDDFRHSDDGVTIKDYKAGDTKSVSDACADAAERCKKGRSPGKSRGGGPDGQVVTPSSSAPVPQPTAKKPAPASIASAKPPRKRGRKS